MIHTMTKATVGGKGVFQLSPSLEEVRAGTQGTDLQAGADTTFFTNQDHLPRPDTSHHGLDSSVPIIKQSRKCSTSQFCGATFSVEVHSSQMTSACVKLTKARQYRGLSHTPNNHQHTLSSFSLVSLAYWLLTMWPRVLDILVWSLAGRPVLLCCVWFWWAKGLS